MRHATPSSVIPVVLRRMRWPLLSVIAAYTISIFGFTLIPGEDDQGEPWRMGFFHAFYFVTYTAPTIGFGEIPYAFTEGQRLWASLSIYLTVIAWFYAIGTIIRLIQEPTFRQAVVRNRFRRQVRMLSEPFYLVCGFGDTGSQLVAALTRQGHRVVVLDIDPERAVDVSLSELPVDVPILCADAGQPDTLEVAGITHPCCVGVLAMTNNDQTNLYIAISAKLLNPPLQVIGRAERPGTEANMYSFGTEHVIDPFASFAQELALAIDRPEVHRVHRRLSGATNSLLLPKRQPPRGRWIVCGYGRQGKQLYRALRELGIEVVVVEAATLPDLPAGHVNGRGTEAATLRAAGIERADAVVAATSSDADNLSIIMTARELKQDLFLVGRQTEGGDERIFTAAGLDMVMLNSRIVSSRTLNLISVPLLSEFFERLPEQPPAAVEHLLARLDALCGPTRPAVWSVQLGADQAEAVVAALQGGVSVPLEMLLREPRSRADRLPLEPLLLARGEQRLLLPDPQQSVAVGDRLLFCGRAQAIGRQRWTLRNRNAFSYVLTGEQRPDGALWRWWYQRRARR